MIQLIWFVLIGLAAGWIAGQIMKTANSNWLHYLVVGVVGSLLGGFLFAILGLAATGLVGNLVTSTVGAVVLIAGLRAYDRRRLL
jgi:uncharacterized membrane protein YeaQ/YmgE (transglycosylase-associated protein family)